MVFDKDKAAYDSKVLDSFKKAPANLENVSTSVIFGMMYLMAGESDLKFLIECKAYITQFVSKLEEELHEQKHIYNELSEYIKEL